MVTTELRVPDGDQTRLKCSSTNSSPVWLGDRPHKGSLTSLSRFPNVANGAGRGASEWTDVAYLLSNGQAGDKSRLGPEEGAGTGRRKL